MPSIPPSFVRLAANDASVMSGESSSIPTSDQVPALMYTEPRRRNGTAVDSRGGVVSRRGNHDRAAQTCPTGDLWEEGPKRCSRTDELRQERGRQTKSLEELSRPRLRTRVEALGRSRVRVLGGRDTRQPEVEEVRNEEKRLSDLERRFIGTNRCVELDERVDRHLLDPGALVDLRAGTSAKRPPSPRRCAGHDGGRGSRSACPARR